MKHLANKDDIQFYQFLANEAWVASFKHSMVYSEHYNGSYKSLYDIYDGEPWFLSEETIEKLLLHFEDKLDDVELDDAD